VLDEATAHLDSESEAAIQRALKTALAGRTSLVIAHRLSTVRAADQILVVDGGQIAERGTRDELLTASGVYAGLYRTPFAPQAALRSFLVTHPDGNGSEPAALPNPDAELAADRYACLVGSGCGGVGPSGWAVPGEHSWFWLFQVPAVELFHPVVVSA
jgi:ATP-binding cassette subfamily B protein